MECPHALEALNRKHIALKKPNKVGSEYNNCKDFFSLVLRQLKNVKYRFLWVDVGSSGSSNILLQQVEEEDQGWHHGASTT